MFTWSSWERKTSSRQDTWFGSSLKNLLRCLAFNILLPLDLVTDPETQLNKRTLADVFLKTLSFKSVGLFFKGC